MKSSWKIGKVVGIDIYLHLTVVLLLASVGVSHYLRRGRWDDAVSLLGFIIALFVWMGAAQEAEMVGIKSALSGVPVRDLMIRDFRSLFPDEPLANAVEQVLAGCQEDFPVCRGSEMVGVLTRTDLLGGPGKMGGASGLVGEVMQSRFKTAKPDETVEAAFKRMQERQVKMLPVPRPKN
jgi:CBS domain-containing protein